MTGRAEALERLRRLPDTVEPDRAYEVRPFRPDDAEGVAELFFRVYGESYPQDVYYMPGAVRAAAERGDLHPVVARLDSGEVVGLGALYRSSPPFPGLLEFGLGAVHPAYRGSFILFHLFRALTDRMRELPGAEAIFGEAVCDTIITQHASALFGFKETAMELDLMPGTGAGRISCLVVFLGLRDRRRLLHLPRAWAGPLAGMAAHAELDREIVVLDRAPEPRGETQLKVEVYAAPQIFRGHVLHPGADFRQALQEAEAAALAQGCRVFQWFVDLGAPEGVAVADFLAASGHFPGGLMPRWFDSDGLLLQKLLDPPGVERVQLFSDKAREILAFAAGKA